MTFIRQEPNFFYDIHDIKALKLLELLRLAFRHFTNSDRIFKTRGQNIETTIFFFINCPNYHCAREALFHKINEISGNISRGCSSMIAKILLLSDNKLDFETNIILAMSTMEFIILTERFSCPIFFLIH